jgi:hypothetical protein
MFGMGVKIEDSTKRVEDAAGRAALATHRQGAHAIMEDARKSIVKRPTSSGRDTKGRFKAVGAKTAAPAGKPPYTKRGLIRRAIRYAADREGAVIGTIASQIGTAGSPHELGGEYKGATFEQRPFMLPALQQNLTRIAGDWAGSIGT